MPKRLLASLAFFLAAMPAVLAQDALSPFALRAVSHERTADGYRFDLRIANASETSARIQGRLTVLNVYDAEPPVNLPIAPVEVAGGGEEGISVTWNDPPVFGQVRALLVVNDGVRPSLVESFGFWIIPWREALIAVAGLAGLLILVFGLPRLITYLRTRVPSNMTPYVVEYDDTVMSVASRFDLNWQDVVKANRLAPPYELSPGARIFLPKHALRRPAAPAKKEPPTAAKS